MVETSTALRAKQQEALAAFSAMDNPTSPTSRIDLHWHEAIDDVPEEVSGRS